ncbi:MAG TPA: 2-keto-3-deoxy-galactonokinase, partial [Franconibacter helveticus]|nr:2-keto-3-deoxy-galactonokinase [Franconibacter helveticus]
MSDYIAVDWGSSNFRAMRVNRGEVVKSVASPKGVARTPREALGVILREELARLGDDYDASTPV